MTLFMGSVIVGVSLYSEQNVRQIPLMLCVKIPQVKLQPVWQTSLTVETDLCSNVRSINQSSKRNLSHGQHLIQTAGFIFSHPLWLVSYRQRLAFAPTCL